jgi:hypothetical protein
MKILNDIVCNFNSNSIQLNSNSTIGLTIQLKRNEMQIGGEGIKNLLVNMVFNVFF